MASDPHLIVLGDAACGKTNLLRLIARTVAHRHTPDRARLVIADYRRGLFGAVEGDHLLDYSPSGKAFTESLPQLVGTQAGNPLRPLVDLLPQARDVGLHLILARRCGGAARALYEPVLQRLRELDTPGLPTSGNRDEGQIFGKLRPGPQPPGRGTLVRRSDGEQLIQTAWTEP